MIAPASMVMLKSAYHFSEDVNAYNDVFKNVKRRHDNRVFCVDPYENINLETIFLGDGHHLNDKGLDLVYYAVLKYFEKWRNNNEI